MWRYNVPVLLSLEKAMAPHSSTLAWKIPWMEEPGRLQSMGSLRVGHDLATSLHFSLSRIGEGNGNPLQCSCLENPRDREACWAAVSGVAQSRTRLKRLSSSSNCCLLVGGGEDISSMLSSWNRYLISLKVLYVTQVICQKLQGWKGFRDILLR